MDTRDGLLYIIQFQLQGGGGYPLWAKLPASSMPAGAGWQEDYCLAEKDCAQSRLEVPRVSLSQSQRREQE